MNPGQATTDMAGVPATARPSAPRITRACGSCSRQKVRCDGGHPCGRCTTLHQTQACEYRPSMRGKTRKRKARTMHDGADHGGEEGTRPPKGEHLGGDLVRDNEEREQHYASWRRTNSLCEQGIPNTAVWGSSTKRQDGGLPAPGPDPALALNHRLTTLPLPGDAPNPLAMLAEASASAQAVQLPTSGAGIGVSPVAGAGATGPSVGQDDPTDSYYAPFQKRLKDDAPHIMTLISVSESVNIPSLAEQLFESYFKYLHPHFPILDPARSTPIAVARRNNFLFNAICCVSARTCNVVLWERLRRGFARFEMERLPREKSVEVVQAHLLYAQWNLIKPKHFEQDMTWQRVGLAVRAGLDINLHRIALVAQARDQLPSWITRNILRTWLCVYVVDRTLSSQLGKPPSVRGENAIKLYLDLLRSHKEKNSVEDLWVVALAEWTMILTRATDVFRNEAADYTSGLARRFGSQTSALPDLVHVFAAQMRQWRERSFLSLEQLVDASALTRIVRASISIYENYARLIIHSFGLQRSTEDPGPDLPAALIEYQTSAVRLIHDFEHQLETENSIRACPDFVFTVLTYAAVSVLKTASIALAGFVPDIRSASRAADILSRAALSADHLPATQHALITRLIASHRDKLSSAPLHGTASAAMPVTEALGTLGTLGMPGELSSVDPDPQAFSTGLRDPAPTGENLDLAGWQDFLSTTGGETPGQASYSFFTSTDWQSKSINDTWNFLDIAEIAL